MRAARRRLLQAAAASVLARPALAAPSVKLGLTLPLSSVSKQAMVSTSAFAPDLGQDYLVAFRAALEGPRGLVAEVVALDDAGVPERALQNLEKLAADTSVLAVSGLWTTDIARHVADTLRKNALPAVGLRSGSPELVSANLPEFFFLKPTWEDEVSALARSLQQTGLTNFALLVGNGPEGQRLLKAFSATGAKAVATESVDPQADAGALARKLAEAEGVHVILLLVHGLALATAVSALRGGESLMLRPVCTLSIALTRGLVESRDRRYAGMAVSSPYPNPATWSAPIARRFRDAMTELELDHATRSFTAFEGFVAGTLLARALTVLGPRPSREALATVLRTRPWELDGVRINFDKQQVGNRATQLLVKSRDDGRFKG